MPDRNKYDMDFRPKSYWRDAIMARLANIKGDIRRRTVLDAFNSGSAGRLEESMLQESLPENMREAVGKIHPTYMGGEYLPDSEENEVEIARVRLMSTTGDVFSVRARYDGKYIYYRVVDEYESDLKASPERSERPLSFEELIALINGIEGASDNGNGLTSVFRDEGASPDFVNVSSIFYPDLERWYREEAVEEADRFQSRD